MKKYGGLFTIIILVTVLLFGCADNKNSNENINNTDLASETIENNQDKIVYDDDIFADYINPFEWDKKGSSFNINLEEFDARVTSMAGEMGWKEFERNTGFLKSKTEDNRYTYKFKTDDGATLAFGVVRLNGEPIKLRFQKDSDIMGNDERNDIKKKMLVLLIGEYVKDYDGEITTTPTCRVNEWVNEIEFEPYQEVTCNDIVVNEFKNDIASHGYRGASSELLSCDSNGNFNVLIEAYRAEGTMYFLGWYNKDFTVAESTDIYRYPSFDAMPKSEAKKLAKSEEWRDAFGWK